MNILTKNILNKSKSLVIKKKQKNKKTHKKKQKQTQKNKKTKARVDKTARTGKKPGGKPPAPPSTGVRPTDQINLTDADSRIMPAKGKGFEQSYNAQAAVDTESMLVVATSMAQVATDKQQVEPMLKGHFYKSSNPATLLLCKPACLTLRTATPV